MDLRQDSIPQHVAFILDGNRRFAKRLMLHPLKGHEWGAKKVEEVAKWCRELNIKYGTLYAFSIQNFGRPKNEFNYLMDLFEKETLKLLDPEHDVHKYKTRVRFIGRLWMLPKKLQDVFKRVEEATKDYSNYFLTFAIAYGGQEEITDSIKEISRKIFEGILKPEDINEELVRHSLYTNGVPYPDLIIRTGGEKRLSNFLLWQSAYSELAFTEKTWPEFSKEDLLGILEDFQKRERRFGH
jgi:tritrans,polycis-undecaprenyl-diphosphate synthase [geranylgeranyl-diphosphate specific]